MNKEKFHRNLIFVIVFQLVVASSWRTESDFLLLAELHLQERRGMMSWDHCTFLENCPPTPPLRQHFALSEK